MKAVSDPGLAEDLTQETFLRAFRNMGRLEEERGIWPWLSTVARNLCIDESRSAALRAVPVEGIVELADDPSPGDLTWDEVSIRHKRARLGMHLARALGELNVRDRRIVLVKAVEDMTWEDIARAEGTTTDLVRNAAWRARTALPPLLDSARRERPTLGLLPVFHAAREFVQRVRTRLAARFGAAGRIADEALAAQLAGALIGVALLGAGWIGADGVRPAHASVPGKPVESATASVLGETWSGADVAAVATSNDPRSDSTDSPSNLVDAAIETGPRNHRVAPASGRIVIEVRDQDGNLLYQGYYRWNCEREGSDVLPQQGPVRAVC